MPRSKRIVRESPVIGRFGRDEIRSVVEGVHVVPVSGGDWTVRKSGGQRIEKYFHTQDDAVEFARKVSEKAGLQMFVHGKLLQDPRKSESRS